MVPFIIKYDDTDQAVKQSMGIEPIFSTPIGVMQIDKALNNKILAFINSKEIKFMRNNGGNGLGIDENFLDNDELSDVKQLLTDSVNEYFKKAVNPNKDTKLYITISWLNVTENGESHHIHHHPNSIVSGVFYIDTCEEDTISFLNPKTDMFGHFNFSKNSNNPGEWTYPATTGRLIVFPSTLRHHVKSRPNTCKGKRISLSFNTWTKGTIGSGSGRKDKLHL
jgi:uncharacterized protein (TIGR02466 family)|tara:strand:- start:35 stop:703 length:669 start_codon:yes stop_codon:yes gene_type:complete